jgi:putative oxidoreductase
MTNLVSLILRIALGTVFIAHGSQKVFGMFGGPGIDGFAKMLTGLGFKPALFWAYVGAYVELLGGLALITGLSTRISALLLLIFIIVATLKVHLAKGFFMSNGGFEYNFLIALACIALIILGTGRFGITKKF